MIYPLDLTKLGGKEKESKNMTFSNATQVAFLQRLQFINPSIIAIFAV